MALPHSPEEKELTEGDPERALRARGSWMKPLLLLLSMRNYAKKMASKQQANPSCATGIAFIEFLLDKSDGRLHYLG